MRLHHILIAGGAFVLIFSLIKIWQATNGLPERPHWSQLGERAGIDNDAANGRANWITLPESWRP